MITQNEVRVGLKDLVSSLCLMGAMGASADVGITVNGVDASVGVSGSGYTFSASSAKMASTAGWSYSAPKLTLSGPGPFVLSGHPAKGVHIVVAADCTIVASNLVVEVHDGETSPLDCGNYKVTLACYSDEGSMNQFNGEGNLTDGVSSGIRVIGSGSIFITNLNGKAVLLAKGSRGAGIGTAYDDSQCGEITIAGGTIFTDSGSWGIGGNNTGRVEIRSGLVFANGNHFGIGWSEKDNRVCDNTEQGTDKLGVGGRSKNGGVLVISGGNVQARGSSDAGIGAGQVRILGGKVFASGERVHEDFDASIRESKNLLQTLATIEREADYFVHNDWVGSGIVIDEKIIISGGEVKAKGGHVGIGRRKFHGEVVISGGITNVPRRLWKPSHGEVVISGGIVNADGFYNGIDGSRVVISGGLVNTHGDECGIGNNSQDGTVVEISGGTVLAKGGKHDIGSTRKDRYNRDTKTASGSNVFTGGSIELEHGSVVPAPTDGKGGAVNCVKVGDVNSPEALSAVCAALAECGYGTNGIQASADSRVCPWLTETAVKTFGVAFGAAMETAKAQAQLAEAKKNEALSKVVSGYREGAAKGDPEAQYNLGRCYEDGNGVEKDAVKAVKWYRLAAEQGNAKAQGRMGSCCMNAVGIAKNTDEAFKWFRKAADQGDVRGQNGIGICYLNGWGTEKNPAEGVKWIRKAAEQGFNLAQRNLGDCYDNGKGVNKNEVEAVKWYRKAAEQGLALAQWYLGIGYENGTGVDKDGAEAVKWYRKAAEQGFALAQCSLGVCYENGTGVDKDEAEAVKWYRKAANQGLAWAQRNLGLCYYFGKSVEKDKTAGLQWLRKAAAQGDKKAKEILNRLHE